MPSPLLPSRCQRMHQGTPVVKTRFVYEVPHSTSCSSQCSTRCASASSHEVLNRILQVRYVHCQVTQHTNETALPRLLYIVDWFVTVTLSRLFQSRACHTFRSCTVRSAGARSAAHVKQRLWSTQRIRDRRQQASWSRSGYAASLRT